MQSQTLKVNAGTHALSMIKANGAYKTFRVAHRFANSITIKHGESEYTFRVDSWKFWNTVRNTTVNFLRKKNQWNEQKQWPKR